MADVTLCVNRECSNRMACYRYRARYGSWQSVARFIPDGAESCTFFSTLRENDIIVSEKEADERTDRDPAPSGWPSYGISKGPMG